MNIPAAADVLGERAQADVPIGPLTTYRVGGRAALLFEVHTADDLALAARGVDAGRLPGLGVGGGSNMLVSDRGFPGLAVVMGSGVDHIEITKPDGGNGATVRAGGATALP